MVQHLYLLVGVKSSWFEFEAKAEGRFITVKKNSLPFLPFYTFTCTNLAKHLYSGLRGQFIGIYGLAPLWSRGGFYANACACVCATAP